MREYSLWSRRASKGLNGYAALFSPPLDRASAVTRLPAPAVANRRANASLRRRQVLTVMFTAISMPALVALATGSMTAWWVVVAMLPFVSTYVAVLFRTRRRMAEREINVAFYGSCRWHARWLGRNVHCPGCPAGARRGGRGDLKVLAGADQAARTARSKMPG